MKRSEGDSRERSVCDHCGFVDYVNPRIVVGAVCAWEDRILLCRRSIEPRRTGVALFRFSATVSVSGIAILLLVWIDRLLLSVLRPANEVGIYQAATQPAFVFSTILVSFNAILVPMIDLVTIGAGGGSIAYVDSAGGFHVGPPLCQHHLT